MAVYKKGYIYFDTNTLECRHSGKSLFLSQFTVNTFYYEVEDLIRTMGLVDKVEICIPEIVWFELQEHLVKHFKSEKSSMETKINAFRKSFGDLAEITCEFRSCYTESDYLDYVKDIAKSFLENPRVTAKIVHCPIDESTILQIIRQAICSVRPFKTAKSGGKEYTDAGFKDALIFNTIISNTEDQLGILISNDNDFSELFSEVKSNNLKMCRTINDVKEALSQAFNVVYIDMKEELFSANNYLMKRILSECGFDEDMPFDTLNIICQENTEDGVKTIFTTRIDDAKYRFEIVYDVSSKELITVSSEFADENEDE